MLTMRHHRFLTSAEINIEGTCQSSNATNNLTFLLTNTWRYENINTQLYTVKIITFVTTELNFSTIGDSRFCMYNSCF